MEFQMLKTIRTVPLDKRSSVRVINRRWKTHIKNGYNDLDNVLTKSLTKEAKSNYKKTLDELKKKIKKGFPNENLSEKMIEKELNKTIGGRTLKQRLKLGSNNLYKNASKSMQDNILKNIREHVDKGESIDKMTRDIKKILDTDTYKARRIARTESHRMNEYSNYEGMQEMQKIAPFKREWLSTNDGRTREDHRHLNGKFEDKDGYFRIGGMMAKYPSDFGIASQDIHCRCTVVANFDEML